MLTAALRAERPDSLSTPQATRESPTSMPARFIRRNAWLATPCCQGSSRQACEAANVPWGHVSSGCIYTGSRPDGSGFTEEDAPISHSGRTTVPSIAGQRPLVKKSWRSTRTFTSGVSDSLRSIRTPAQLSHQTHALLDAPRSDQLDLGLARVRAMPVCFAG